MSFTGLRNNRYTIIRLVAANLMIIIGTIIYITSRHDIIFFRWIPISIIDTFREYSIESHTFLGYLIVYCIPDGLWYGALLLIQRTLMVKSFISRSMFWISAALPFIWEVLQILDPIPGTFDPMDLCIYSIILLFFMTIKYKLHD